ncbi:MAG: hypothetical protein ACYYK0_06120 [Candidatus Eutrophobiaceae bacterium]
MKTSIHMNSPVTALARGLSALLACVFFVQSTLAVDDSGNFAVWGLGKKSCIAYTSARAEGGEQDIAYQNYLMGFLTATNFFMDETYSISGNSNIEKILEWIDGHCEQKPISSFESAINEYSTQHYQKRKKIPGSTSW